MDAIKENKTLAAILGVMVVGGLGLVAFLVTSYMGFTSSMEQYDTASNAVATLKGAKLFPSAENVKEKETAVAEYGQAVDTLGTVLLKLQPPITPLSETEFQAKLKTGIARAKEAAGKTTSLPKEFAFGFDIYTGSLPKNAQVATDLGDYLAAVENITDLAIASGVASIDTITRSELQIEKGAPPPAPTPSAKKGGTKATLGKGAVKAVKELAKVVERRTLTLTLTADQAPLQRMMNELASPSKMPYFTVVRQLRVENEKQEGPLRGSLSIAPPIENTAPELTSPAEGGVPADPAAPVAPKVEVIEAVKPAVHDAQAVFGDEKLKIYLEIDIVRYLEPA